MERNRKNNAFAIAIFLAFALISSVFLAEETSAQQLGCCLKTISGDYCVDRVRADNCEGGFFFTGKACSNINQCKSVTCIPNEGECQANKLLFECQAERGKFDTRPLEEVEACQKGGCNIGGIMCEVLQKKVCEDKARDSGFSSEDVTFTVGMSEIEVRQQCSASGRGTCDLGGGNCDYTTSDDCASKGGDFISDVLPSQIKNCAVVNAKVKKGCGVLPGDENKIFWFNDQGSQEALVEDCNYPLAFCKEEVVNGVETAICKSTSCNFELLEKDSDGRQGKQTLLSGTSMCYNFNTDLNGKSTGLQHQILHCALGKIRVEGLGVDRNKICIDELSSDKLKKSIGFILKDVEEGKVIDNARVATNLWEECRACGEANGNWFGKIAAAGAQYEFLTPTDTPDFFNIIMGATALMDDAQNRIGDVFQLIPFAIPPGPWINTMLIGSACGGSKSLKSIKFIDDLASDFGLCSYERDLIPWGGFGSAIPMVNPGTTEQCFSCGDGGDDLWNVCDPAECNALGDCEEVQAFSFEPIFGAYATAAIASSAFAVQSCTLTEGIGSLGDVVGCWKEFGKAQSEFYDNTIGALLEQFGSPHKVYKGDDLLALSEVKGDRISYYISNKEILSKTLNDANVNVEDFRGMSSDRIAGVLQSIGFSHAKSLGILNAAERGYNDLIDEATRLLNDAEGINELRTERGNLWQAIQDGDPQAISTAMTALSNAKSALGTEVTPPTLPSPEEIPSEEITTSPNGESVESIAIFKKTSGLPWEGATGFSQPYYFISYYLEGGGVERYVITSRGTYETEGGAPFSNENAKEITESQTVNKIIGDYDIVARIKGEEKISVTGKVVKTSPINTQADLLFDGEVQDQEPTVEEQEPEPTPTPTTQETQPEPTAPGRRYEDISGIQAVNIQEKASSITKSWYGISKGILLGAATTLGYGPEAGYSCRPETPMLGEGTSLCKTCESEDGFRVCTKERCEILGMCKAIAKEDGDGFNCVEAACNTTEGQRQPEIVKIEVEFMLGNKIIKTMEGRGSVAAGTIPWNVTQLKVTIQTNVGANCRFSTTPNTAWSDAIEFEGAAYMPKEQEVTLTAGGAEMQHSIFIKCQNVCGIENPASNDRFFVKYEKGKLPDFMPPIVTYIDPANVFVPEEPSIVTTRIHLSENGNCFFSRNLTDTKISDMQSMDCVQSQECMLTGRNNCAVCKVDTDVSAGEVFDFSEFEQLAGAESLAEVGRENEISETKISQMVFRCADLQGNEGEIQNYMLATISNLIVNITSPEEGFSTFDTEVSLAVETNHPALCKFSLDSEKDFTKMDEITGEYGTLHEKLLENLTATSHTIYVACEDSAMQERKASRTFTIATDSTPPILIRAFRELTSTGAEVLKIITDEKSSCRYSLEKAGFNFEEGIEMPFAESKEHIAEWGFSTYYVKCRDKYDNERARTIKPVKD